MRPLQAKVDMHTPWKHEDPRSLVASTRQVDIYNFHALVICTPALLPG